MEDHLLDHIKRWNGIGDFAEVFVEQGHQLGVRNEYRTKGKRDWAKEVGAHINFSMTINKV